MLVTIKTLQQDTFKVDVEDTALVKVLKEKIAIEKGDAFPVQGQKLIYSGKIMEDEKTVAEYNIAADKFIVAMVTKVKAKPVAVVATSSKPEEAETKESDEPKEASSSEPAVPAPAPVPSVAAAPANEAVPEDPENFNETVSNIVALGYPRSQVEAALRTSGFNPDLAVSYLEGDVGVVPAVASGTPGGQQVSAANPASLGQMRSMIQASPQLQQVVEVVRQNPQMLQTFMEQIGQQNPDLLRFISENQNDFVNYINNSAQDVEQPPIQEQQGGQEAPPQNFVSVTPEERGEIEHLKSMGFAEQDCIQAYLACNKDVQLAANFLLTSD